MPRSPGSLFVWGLWMLELESTESSVCVGQGGEEAREQTSPSQRPQRQASFLEGARPLLSPSTPVCAAGTDRPPADRVTPTPRSRAEPTNPQHLPPLPTPWQAH